jgi:transcription antitermination factor NusG
MTRSAHTDHACWFAARTHCGAELGVRDRLGRLGTENFLPTEHQMHTRSHTTYERPLIPGLIFLRTTKKQACALTNELGLPVRYLIDPATRTLLVVPDKQMDDFRRVLDLSLEAGGLMDRPLELGDFVRVVKGVLRGVEGRVMELHGQYYVVVELLGSFFARASVPRSWLERIDPSSMANHKYN